MTDSLSAQHVDLLLTALSTDDTFRNLFTSDPAAALEKLGLPASFALCCSKAKSLASKEVISTTRGVLVSQLMGKQTHNIHGLDAG